MRKPPLPSRLNTYTSVKEASQTDRSGMEDTIPYHTIGGSFDTFNFYLNSVHLERGY